MESPELHEDFWTTLYKKGDTGWDIGHVSTPIKEYFDQIDDKSLKILIPGGGNSHEAEYLYNSGFKNVWVADIAKPPLDNLKSRCPAFPDKNLIHSDFFELQDTYDIIVEQTFFCALSPKLRMSYVRKCHDLLNENGYILGLLFKVPLHDNRPPFGGNENEYRSLFKAYFHILKMEEAYNSIAKRSGNELFIKLLKRKVVETDISSGNN